MPRFNFLRLALVVLLSVSMSHLPNAVAAEVVSAGMISTSEIVDSLSRTELEAKVRAHLDREDLQRELAKYGVAADEVSSRLATLSNAELDRLAKQMDEAQYGGNVVGLLVIALLVILIIYFAKRI
ncbi:MAG: PA2779 family protein [Bdellovibrionota bacterium]